MGKNHYSDEDRNWVHMGVRATIRTHDEERSRMAIAQGQIFIEIRHRLEASRRQGLSWEAAWEKLSVSDHRHLAPCAVHWRDAYLGRAAPSEIAALTRCGLF
jgi:hypothetical protein